jgi:hypothetical protein
MSNEAYLIVSYFGAGVFCLLLSLAAYLWLRRPTEGIADSLLHKNWQKIIRKAFPLSTILFVLSSCLSVNYYGCQLKKYSEILNDRSYIAAKNAEQISQSLNAILWSVAVWSIILAVALLRGRRRSSL